MELAEVDGRYRITIPKDVRAAFKVVKGQRFYLIPYGGDILMKPVPADPAEELGRVIGDFEFGKDARRGAEEWLLKQPSR
ncbi:MAG: AbrB/MazE/SpoVT family DNA-binding domain-containing protein [Nitrososphaerales archaeon]